MPVGQCLKYRLRIVWQNDLAATGAVKIGEAREKQFQMIVQLRHRADRGARCANGIRLIDRYRRRNAVDRLDLRFIHPVEELPRVW